MTLVTLMGSPDWKSLLTWSANCTVDGNGYCTITMDANKTVTATFNFKPQVMMPGPTYYATVQDAYNAVSGSTVIKVRNLTFAEDLVFNLPMDVTLDGGYDDTWATQAGSTNVSGTVTIEAGSLTVNNLSIL